MQRSPTIALALLTMLCALAALPPSAAALSDDAIAQLKLGGHVILMRHAQTTPSVGDPPGYTLNNCASQRNLGETGRADAQRFGAALRNNGIRIDRILSSVWCRSIDTARLALPGMEVQVEPNLNSTFDERDSAARRAAAEGVRATIAAWSGPGNLLMVTHQVNIGAITNRSVAQGAMLILKPKPGGFDIVAETSP